MGIVCEIDAATLSELFRKNQCLVLKNCELNNKIHSIEKKVDYYSKLSCSNDYERGFNRAFEMVKNFFKES